MRPRQSLPTLWLMTDERIGDRLWAALERLPRGAGVVFRHYQTPLPDRRQLYDQIRRIARRRGLVLVLAGTAGQAIAWRADGVHGRSARCRPGRRLVRTAPAHDAREAIAAARAAADLIFVSPVVATRSHPGGRALGVAGFGRLARSVPAGMLGKRAPRLIALGGMTVARFSQLRPLGAYGWAAIDALTPAADQKRKVVPR